MLFVQNSLQLLILCLFLVIWTLIVAAMSSEETDECYIPPKGEDSCQMCNYILSKQKCAMTKKVVKAMQILDDGCARAKIKSKTTKECNKEMQAATYEMGDALQKFETATICKPACDNSPDLLLSESHLKESDDGKEKILKSSNENKIGISAAGSTCAAKVSKCVAFLEKVKSTATAQFDFGILDQGCGAVDDFIEIKCKVMEGQTAKGVLAAIAKIMPEKICMLEC